jgi:TrmH family RNA methyltransferase
MGAITSRQHAIVRAFRAAARGDERSLLLDGWHLVQAASAARLAITRVAFSSDPTPAERALLSALERRGAALARVSPAVLRALSPVRAPSGVVALADRPSAAGAALTLPDPALVLALFGVQDPGNVGAVARAAEAGGATGLLADAATADPWSWKALRASMGSAFRLPVKRVEAAPAIVARWRRQGLTVVAADPRGPTGLYDADLARPAVILLGGEGGGLPPEVLALASARVAIPMRPPVESLNVAVAAALLTYEAARQRLRTPDRVGTHT